MQEKELERKTKVEETQKAIRSFCRKYLDEEYLELSLKLLDKIFLETDPLKVNGKPNNIAAGVMHIIAMTNLLFDTDMTPHISSKTIADELNAPPGPTASRSRMIRKKFGISYYHPEYSSKAVLAMKPDENSAPVFVSKKEKKSHEVDPDWVAGNTYEIVMQSKRKVTTKALAAVRGEIRKLSMVPQNEEPEADLIEYELKGFYFRFRIILGRSDIDYMKRFLEVHLPNMRLCDFIQIY